MDLKESDIQRAILQWLQLKKYCVWRNYLGPVIHRDGHFSPNPAKGMPDIMGVLKNGSGRLFGIEVKKPGKYATPDQRIRLDALNKAGALAFIAKDLDTVIKTMEKAEANDQ